MRRSVANYLAQALRPGHGWHPLLAVYYLTYACELRCPYCSDGLGRPYHTLADETQPLDRALILLRRIRSYCDWLVLTGGEPLQYPALDALLQALPSLKYDGIVFTTNGLRLEPHLERLVTTVTHLGFSLDTLDEAKADALFGAGPGVLRQVLTNLEKAIHHPRRTCEVMISAVATPDNLPDLFEVYAFARERDLRFALCPQLQGVHPHPQLRGNPAYRALFDHLLAEKRRGARIQGSPAYLEHMRDLRQFRCHPFTTLAVAPGGDVFYPCLELGQVAGNLFENPDLDAIKREGERRFGLQPACDNRCQSACALGFSVALNQPSSALEELACLARGALSGRRK